MSDTLKICPFSGEECGKHCPLYVGVYDAMVLSAGVKQIYECVFEKIADNIASIER